MMQTVLAQIEVGSSGNLWMAYGAAAFMLFMLMIVIGIWLFTLTRPLPVIKSKGGNVRVSRAAITDLVQSICHKEGTEEHPYVGYKVTGEKINLRLKVKIPADVVLSDFTENLRTKLIDSLQTTLGVNQLGTIDIDATTLPDPQAAQPDIFKPITDKDSTETEPNPEDKSKKDEAFDTDVVEEKGKDTEDKPDEEDFEEKPKQ